MTDATLHADDYQFTLHLDLIPDDERELLKLLLNAQREYAQYLVDIVDEQFRPNPLMTPPTSRFEHNLTYADYDGDHTDYNPAAAHCLATITDCITSDIFWSMPINDDVATALGLTKEQHGHDLELYPFSMKTRLAAILSSPDFLMDVWTCGVSWFSELTEESTPND